MKNLNKKKQKHTSHIAPHTSQKGITLIALIITIIVMLILLGVTINVALNGGLFTKAEQATKETEEKAILEEMLAMMEMDDNGKFKPDEIIGNMRTIHPEYEIDDSNKPNVTIKGKLGEYNYIVSETEIKIGTKENTIRTIWQERGVTSPNVKFDTLYYNGEEMERTDGTGVFFEGMTIGFYSNGDVCLNYNSDVISTKDSNGENVIGSNGAKSSSIDYYLTEGYGHCFDNGITMFLSVDSGYITIRYTSSNTVNVYQGGAAELDSNGNVPENEDYLVGTLLPQE